MWSAFRASPTISAKTFFASSFGMVTDKFGVLWMVMAGGQA